MANQGNRISLKIKVTKPTQVEAILLDDHQTLTVTCQSSDPLQRPPVLPQPTSYQFTCTLFAPVMFNPKTHVTSHQSYIHLALTKLDDGHVKKDNNNDDEDAQAWPRLTKQQIKTPKIQVDWDNTDLPELQQEQEEQEKKLKMKEEYLQSKQRTHELETLLKQHRQDGYGFLKEMKNMYLVAFNAMNAFFWFLVFSIIMIGISRHDYNIHAYAPEVWHECGHFVRVLQTIAVLEVIHGAVGIVPGGVFGALALHLGRNMVLFGPVALLPDVEAIRSSWPIVIIFIGWSFAEMIRYTYYALNVLQCAPYFLKWLRYTVPLIVFPFVAYIEAYVEYLALPYFKERQLMSTQPLPNSWNFTIYGYGVLFFWMSVHILSAPFLFVYMVGTRSKQVSRKDDAAKKSA